MDWLNNILALTDLASYLSLKEIRQEKLVFHFLCVVAFQ